MAVIHHKLRGPDIYEFNSRYQDKPETDRQTLAFNVTNLEITSSDSAGLQVLKLDPDSSRQLFLYSHHA